MPIDIYPEGRKLALIQENLLQGKSEEVAKLVREALSEKVGVKNIL